MSRPLRRLLAERRVERIDERFGGRGHRGLLPCVHRRPPLERSLPLSIWCGNPARMSAMGPARVNLGRLEPFSRARLAVANGAPTYSCAAMIGLGTVRPSALAALGLITLPTSGRDVACQLPTSFR